MERGPHLPESFLRTLHALEESYLTETDPIRQSGFGGGPERWRAERGIVLEAVTADGTFLDTCCANGYLLECLVDWGRRKGVELIPFGLDLGARLIGLARQRFPTCPDHFWAGNAWDWVPPRRFDYVYALTDCVPEPWLGPYLARLLAEVVEKDGLLIVGHYGSMSMKQPARDVGRLLVDLNFTVAGTATSGALPVSHVAWVRS
jgi:hypothetical protein